MALLGCGTHAAFITGRFGYPRFCTVTDVLDVQYCRVLDDTGEAQVKLGLQGSEREACCACLADTNPWCNELHITRNGVEVWAGPIVKVDYGFDDVIITARDVSAWLDVRAIHNALAFVATDLSTIAAAVVIDALTPDDPDLIASLQVIASGNVGDRTYVVGKNAGDAFRELARNGIDFVVLGRRIVIAGDALPLKVIGTLYDQHFIGNARVILDGTLGATKWVVNGSGVVGTCEAGGLNSGATAPEKFCYGLVERSVDETDITDQASADAAACSRLAGSNPVPMFMDLGNQAQLTPDAPIAFDALIPGSLVQVILNRFCRAISTQFRLQQVCVHQDENGEEVKLQMGPVGLTSEVA